MKTHTIHVREDEEYVQMLKELGYSLSEVWRVGRDVCLNESVELSKKRISEWKKNIAFEEDKVRKLQLTGSVIDKGYEKMFNDELKQVDRNKRERMSWINARIKNVRGGTIQGYLEYCDTK